MNSSKASKVKRSVSAKNASFSSPESTKLDRLFASCSRPWWRGLNLAVVAGGVFLASSAKGSAATYEWTGIAGQLLIPPGAYSMTDPTNWVDQVTNLAPAPGTQLSGVGNFLITTKTVQQILNDANFKVGGITIDSSLAGGVAPAMVTISTIGTPIGGLVLDNTSNGTPAVLDAVGVGDELTIRVDVVLADNLSVNSALGAAGIVVVNRAVRESVAGASVTVAAGELHLTGANTYSGGTTITGGKVVVGNASGLGDKAGPGVTIGDATLELGVGSVAAYNVVVGDGKNATINATESNTLGSLTIGTVSDTTLNVNPSQSAETKTTVGFSDVALAAGSTVNVGGATGNQVTVEVNGTISGDGNLVKTGAGALDLKGDSSGTFDKKIDIQEGAVIANHEGALGSGFGLVKIGEKIPGTTSSLKLNAAPVAPTSVEVRNGALAAAIEVNTPSVTLGDLTFESPLDDPHKPTTLKVINVNDPAVPAVVSFTSINLNDEADTLNVSSPNATVKVEGAISGTAGKSSLIKDGEGTLELRGDSGTTGTNYTGGISVKLGTLVVNGLGALGDAPTGVSVTPAAPYKANSTSITVDGATQINVGDIVRGEDFGSRTYVTKVVTDGTNKVVTLSEAVQVDSSAGSTFSVGRSALASLASGTTLNLKDATRAVGVNAYDIKAATSTIEPFTIELDQPTLAVPGSTTTHKLGAIIVENGSTITVRAGGNANGIAGTPNKAVLKVGEGEKVDGPAVKKATGGFVVGEKKALTVQVENTGAGAGLTTFTTVTVDGVITGDGAKLVKTGDGVLELNNNSNSYSGGTEIKAGTVRMGTNDPAEKEKNQKNKVLGTGLVTLAGGALDVNRNVYDAGKTFNMSLAGRVFDGSIEKDGGIKASVSFNAAITDKSTIEVGLSGTAELVKSGSGELVLMATNSYTGGTVINDGQITLSAGDNTLAENTSIYLQGGTLDLGGSTQQVGSANFVIGGGTVDARLKAGSIEKTAGNFVANVAIGRTVTVADDANMKSGAGGAVGLEKRGDGTLILEGTNDYNSDTVISGGVVEVQAAGALGSGNINLNGGNLRASLRASGDAPVAVAKNISVTENGSSLGGGNRKLTVNGTTTIKGGVALQLGGNIDLAGVVGENGFGVGSIVVDAGSGTATLSRSNTYKGGTTVNSGTLEVAAVNALGGVGDIVVNGGTLSLGADQTTTGAVTLRKGTVSGVGALESASGISAVVAAGDTVTVASNNLSGDLNKSGAGKVELNATNLGLTKITLADGELSLGADQTNVGAVTLNKGTVSGGGTLGSATVITNAAVAAGDTVTVAGNNLRGDLNKSGAGKVVLGATNSGLTKITLTDGELNLLANQTNVGAVTLNKGTVSGGGALGSASVVTNAAVAAGDTVTVAGDNLRGDLDKSGAGKVVLGGTNSSLTKITLKDGELNLLANQTATGAVTLNNGVVSGTSTLASASGTITAAVAAGDTVTVKGDNLRGVLDKSGVGKVVLGVTNSGLTKITLKDGELNLLANQTNVGAVDLTKGTVSGVGKLGGSAGVITTAAVAAGDTVTVAGNNLIGVLNKSGAGTVELNGTNSGLTKVTLTGGELSLGANQANVGEVTLNVGTVSGVGKIGGSASKINADVAAGSTLTVAGDNLRGDLDKSGAGKVVLAATNSGLEGITLTAGELNFGKEQATAGTILLKSGTLSGPGRLVSSNSSGVVVDTANKVEVATGIASEYGLTKKGGGELRLSGDNKGLTGVSVESGTVTITRQAALGVGVVKVDSGAVLDATTDVRQQGSTMTVNGTLRTGTLTVGAGQTLLGNGQITGKVKLENGAVVAPGNSPGVLQMTSLSGNGVYEWERSVPGSTAPGFTHDAIQLSQPSDLSNITVRAKTSAGATLPVVSTVAGAQSLAYDQVQVNPTQSLRYASIIIGDTSPGLPKFDGPDTAVIKVRMVRRDDPSSPAVDLVVDRTSYAEFSSGRGGESFGAYLDAQLATSYASTGSLGQLLRDLDATVASSDVAARLRAINPGNAYASLYTVGIRRANSVAIPLEDHLDAIGSAATGETSVKLGAVVGKGSARAPVSTPEDDGKNWTVWTAGHGSRVSIDADSSSGSLKSNDNGAALGVEHRFGNLRVGGIASMGQGSTSFQDPSVRVESDHWHAGGYATVAIGAVTVDTSALFGSSDESSTRGVAGGRADASFGSTDAQLGLGVSMNLIAKNGAWQLTPVFRLKYVSYEQDGFSEAGPNGALLFRAAALSEDTVISKLGVRVAHRSQLSKDFALGVDGAAYWVHDFRSEGRDLSMNLNGAVGSFRATGRDGFADTAQLNLGLQATLSEVVSIRLSGQQEIGVNRTQSTGVFAMGLSF